MNRVTLLKEDIKKSNRLKNNELVSFVAKQFKQLTRRNLRVPIQLFHL